MTYEEIQGDLFEHAKSGYLIHGCNAQGVMGSGVARIVKEKWPHVFEEYHNWHEAGVQISSTMELGKFQAVEAEKGLVVLNAITQDLFGTYQRQVDYDAVARIFESLVRYLPDGATLYMPMIGAGLGGGNWNIIKTIIQETLNEKDVHVKVYYL